MFFSSIKEINTSLSRGMSNIYYWEKLTFSKLQFSRKNFLKNCAIFEDQIGTRNLRGNVYFGIIIFGCLSSTKPCIRFLLICFAREIKGFHQSSLGNEVDFRDIIQVSSNILTKKQNFEKPRQNFVDEKAMIAATLISSCHWKTIVPFRLRKRPENAFLTLTVNYRKIVQKNKLWHSKQK